MTLDLLWQSKGADETKQQIIRLPSLLSFCRRLKQGSNLPLDSSRWSPNFDIVLGRNLAPALIARRKHCQVGATSIEYPLGKNYFYPKKKNKIHMT